MTRRPAGHARQADGSASGERMGLDLAVPLTAPLMGTQHLCSCFGAHVDKLPGLNGSLCSHCPSPSLCRASSPGSPGMLAPQPALRVSSEQGAGLLSAPTFSPGISSTQCGFLWTTTRDGACGLAVPGGRGRGVIFWEGRWGGGEQQLAARWSPGSPTQQFVSAPSA